LNDARSDVGNNSHIDDWESSTKINSSSFFRPRPFFSFGGVAPFGVKQIAVTLPLTFSRERAIRVWRFDSCVIGSTGRSAEPSKSGAPLVCGGKNWAFIRPGQTIDPCLGSDCVVVAAPFLKSKPACISKPNSVSFRNSSRRRPLKLSMKAFCAGLPGSM